MPNKKQPLILLHGALGTKNEFDDLIPELEKDFELHWLNFEGHGENTPTDRPFRIDHFAESVVEYLDENEISKVNIFGYSMGGYVALVLAKNHPKRIKRVATLGTVLQWIGEVAERECRYLNPVKIEEKVPHFAKKLDERHSSGWKEVVNKTKEMLQYLGFNPNLTDNDWREIKAPIRIHIGDRDTTAGLAPTIEVYKKIEQAELSVLPATPHPLEKVNKEALAASLKEFL
ncbi:MAG TPA: alpha/beta fold hydrolase [Balneolaceae bacterium]